MTVHILHELVKALTFFKCLFVPATGDITGKHYPITIH